MKLKRLFFTSLASPVAIGILGTGAWALSDDETRYQLQCITTGLGPRVVLAEGPIEIGTEWKYFPIPDSIKRYPFIDKFEIEGSHLHHRMTEDLPKLLPNDLGYRWGLLDTRTNKASLFSVKVIDDQGREVRLTQNSWYFRTTTNPPTPAPQFSLGHQRWEKGFFAP